MGTSLVLMERQMGGGKPATTTHQNVDGGELEGVARPDNGPDLPKALHPISRPRALGDPKVARLEEERVHPRLPHALLDEGRVGGDPPCVCIRYIRGDHARLEVVVKRSNAKPNA
jgi:hypothetical protein